MPMTMHAAAAILFLATATVTATICTSPKPYVFEPRFFVAAGTADTVPTTLLSPASPGPSIQISNTSTAVLQAGVVANGQQTVVFAIYDALSEVGHLSWVDTTTQLYTETTSETFLCEGGPSSQFRFQLAAASNANAAYVLPEGNGFNITIFSSLPPYGIVGHVVPHSSYGGSIALTCSPSTAATSYLYVLYNGPSTLTIDLYTITATTGALAYAKTITTYIPFCTFQCVPTLLEIEGNLWVMTMQSSYQIVVFNITSGLNITTINGISGPSQLVYDPVTRRAFANSRGAEVVSIISTASYSIIEALVWTSNANYIALHPSNPAQLIVADGASALAVFDVNTRKLVLPSQTTVALSALIAVQPPPVCRSDAAGRLPSTTVSWIATIAIAGLLASAI